MKTIIITNDPQIATDAEIAGVSRIMVDLESIGKKERQASRTTFISSHKAQDIEKIKKSLKNSELIVRVNPVHENSAQEIEQAIVSGADIIMLPMINALEEIDTAVNLIAGRAKFMPLVETAYSMAHIEEISANSAVDEVYIGLNDLHLSLGLDFLFEPLAVGLVDWMVEKIKLSGKSFGFGGIATMGSGELPAESILAENIRLVSTCVILSSRFCKDVGIQNQDGRVGRIKNALAEMAKKEKELKKRSLEETNAEQQRTNLIIKNLALKAHDLQKRNKYFF